MQGYVQEAHVAGMLSELKPSYGREIMREGMAEYRVEESCRCTTDHGSVPQPHCGGADLKATAHVSLLSTTFSYREWLVGDTLRGRMVPGGPMEVDA